MIFQSYAARMNNLKFALIALTSVNTAIAADLEFIRLNACEEAFAVLDSLKRQPTNCRSAMGIVERSIVGFFAGSDMKICILEYPPIKSLSDFSCIWESHQGTRATVCIRPITASMLSDYKTNFVSKYSSRTATYIKEAKKCPGSNGDASRTFETTFPPILMPVAKHEFGFVVQFGDTKPGHSMVSHGFARTSTKISKSGPEAIEYVVYSDGLTTELAVPSSLGNWRLHVDTSSEFAAPFLKALKQQGLYIYPASFNIDIKRAPQASALPKVPSLPEALSNIVASRLEIEGFDEMDDAALKQHTGKTREEISKTFQEGIPFGAPKFINTWKSSIRILMKTSGISCTRSGRGAISVYLFAIDHDEGVQADFGNILTLVLGFGACSLPDNSGREYIRNLARESKQAVLDNLESR